MLFHVGKYMVISLGGKGKGLSIQMDSYATNGGTNDVPLPLCLPNIIPILPNTYSLTWYCL
jgi:hypothetical protein